MNQGNQSSYFATIPRFHKTEKELNAPVSVVKISIYGKYTKRGEHRKEIVEADFNEMMEVPVGFNKGHMKLAANRYVRKVLKGIRVRTFYHDAEVQAEKVGHKRRVVDFMSEKGVRDNTRLKRTYDLAVTQRNAEAQKLDSGIVPQGLTDNTQYTEDGQLPYSDRYVDV